MITSISLTHSIVNNGNAKNVNLKDIVNLHLLTIKGERYKDFPFFLLDAGITLVIKGDFVNDLCEIFFNSNDCQIATLSFIDTCKDDTERVFDFEFDFRNVKLLSDCGAEIKGMQFSDCYTKTFNGWETEINFADLGVTEAIVNDIENSDIFVQAVECEFEQTVSNAIIFDSNTILANNDVYVSESGACVGGFRGLGGGGASVATLTILDEDYGNATGISYTATNANDNRITINNSQDAFQIQTQFLKWCLVSSEMSFGQRLDFGGGIFGYQDLKANSLFERLYLEIPSGAIIPNGWQLINDNGIIQKLWRCPVRDENGLFVNDYKQGRKFSDVITFLATETASCIECVKSQFFGIGNVDYTSNAFSNDEYSFAYQNLENMSVHTIADVIYPNADTPAAGIYYVANLKAFFEDLETLFNIRWFIDSDNCLVIEHLSYFKEENVKDFTSCLFGRSYELEADTTKLAKREKWQMLEGSENRDFAGEPIEYGCSLGNATILRSMQVIATDLQFLAKKDKGESGTDKQFVLIARDSENFVISGTGILTGESLLNEPLSISRLHEKLHRYGRLQSNGIMNTQDTNFISITPTLRSSQLTCKSCCEEIEENAQYVLPINQNAKFQGLSNGILQTYVLDLHRNSVIVDFLHTIE